jgi:hypothetical protein
LWPLLLQCEHRLVIPTTELASLYVRARVTRGCEPRARRTKCVAVWCGFFCLYDLFFFPPGRRGDIRGYLTGCALARNDKKGHARLPSLTDGGKLHSCATTRLGATHNFGNFACAFSPLRETHTFYIILFYCYFLLEAKNHPI